MHPVITKPNKTVFISSKKNPDGAGLGSEQLSAQKLFISSLSPSSPVSNRVVPRAPVVQFFVCDYGNAKVKTVSEQFIDLLVKNGIKVFTERYATHQAGFQVRAMSLNSTADFFFQIHSKTAGRGHVRLYLGAQPRRMTIEESISDIWAWWRVMCGALSEQECDVLSAEKLNYALKSFAGLDPSDLDIDSLQIEIRKAISLNEIPYEILEKILALQDKIEYGKKSINMQKQVCLDLPHDQGAEIPRCPGVPIIRGLSQPFKKLLLSLADQALEKLHKLESIVQMYGVSEEVEEQESLEIPVENGGDGEDESTISWSALLESVRQETFGSMNHITSYGDTSSMSPGFHPPSFIDEF